MDSDTFLLTIVQIRRYRPVQTAWTSTMRSPLTQAQAEPRTAQAEPGRWPLPRGKTSPRKDCRPRARILCAISTRPSRARRRLVPGRRTSPLRTSSTSTSTDASGSSTRLRVRRAAPRARASHRVERHRTVRTARTAARAVMTVRTAGKAAKAPRGGRGTSGWTASTKWQRS